MFHVGQKVVCVDAQDTDRRGLKELHKGMVYTIRWVGVYSDEINTTPEMCVRLYEFLNRTDPDWPQFPDIPFFAHRFRPLIERETDTGMAVLKKLLQPKHERVG